MSYLRKVSTLTFALAISIICSISLNAQVKFSRGVNLSNWFQTSGPKQIQFTKYSKKDFENIKNLGCNVIRLPINLFHMTNGQPEYVVDSLFLGFLDEAVNWAEDLEIYLILDNHSTDDIASKNPNLESLLIKVWKQLSERYKNRSEYIIYEIMNEPNGITTQTWGNIQQKAIDSIRISDTTHTIIVGPSNYNSFNDLAQLPVYSDKKLIYTFHFYEPFIFTHQGANWSNPSLVSLLDVPFPYNADSMPALPDNLKSTWIKNSYDTYNVNGTAEKVKELINTAISFKNSRNASLYCGEFGVYKPYVKDSDRDYWYSAVRRYLEENNIAWTTWDYQGTFGLFENGSAEMFDYDLNVALLDSLGLTIPEQKEYVTIADSVGFGIYSDYIEENMFDASTGTNSKIDYYSNQKPNNGKYCLSWTGSDQYGAVGFNFTPNKDLSSVVAEDYALSLLVRGNSPGSKIEVRFIDTKTTDPADHPWRMNYTIDESLVKWDNKWHKVYIPLSDFVDMGSWDNAWYSPNGSFDWKAVDRFEINNDQGSIKNKYFWFDNIMVTNQDTAQINDTTSLILPTAIYDRTKESSINCSVYPNPLTDEDLNIFLEDNSGINRIIINDISGNKVFEKNLTNENAIQLHLTILPGIYFIQLINTQGILAKKLIKL